jgi:DNA-binding response OmpR family regulator
VKGHILIIDDNSIIRALLKDRLTIHGYKVDEARNGLEGLKMVNNGCYDIITSDIEMPIMNGIEFYNSLIVEAPYMKGRVIFVTACTDGETERFIRGTGCRYFLKPLKIDKFLKAVDEVCISGQARRGRERRKEKRIGRETECLIMNGGYTGRSIAATTVDISPTSLGVKYSGEPLTVDNIFEIILKEPDEKREMTVVWSRSIDKIMSAAGLRATGRGSS